VKLSERYKEKREEKETVDGRTIRKVTGINM
jgi:hypothetical protein